MGTWHSRPGRHNTPLSVLPRRPLEVLLTSLWCSAESSEQSVVPHLTCTTPPSCRVHCWCVWTVAHSGVQCSPACMHSSHWSHQHSMTATRRAATRLRLDWTEAGPTLPHSTLVHVQVTECSTATDTHAAGAQDGSHAVSTDSWTQHNTHGPNTTHMDPTQHTNTSSGLRLHVGSTDRGSSSKYNSPFDSAFYNSYRVGLAILSIDPLPRSNASTTLSPTSSCRGPHSPGGRG